LNGGREVYIDNIETKIMEYIEKNPGSYLRQIKTELNISMGTLQYHLRKLEKENKITSSRNGLYKCFFVTRMFKDNEKEIIRYLNQETPRRIIMFVIEQVQPTQNDIARNLRITPPSITWNLKRLLNSKIIIEKKDGRYKRYLLSPDIDSISLAKLLRSYHPSLWNRWSDKLAEIFLSLTYNAENKDKDQK
jgi:predicted transcriptional regulator